VANKVTKVKIRAEAKAVIVANKPDKVDNNLPVQVNKATRDKADNKVLKTRVTKVPAAAAATKIAAAAIKTAVATVKHLLA
jgi:hypothetical protein